ncbi:MAG: TonB-dependent receptor, partial [Candidatus Latescibacteria bacterium]|nr:TonB-dependent receptor [Candidatus Latescibacterota bacterium]
MIRARLLVFTALAAGLVSSSIDAATISGYVRDAASSESLPYVPVFIKNPRAGTMTNEHGYYAIPGLSAGAFELVCAYIGYEKYEQTINVTADEDAIVNINLGEEAIELAVLAISADRDDAETYDISPGRLTLRGTELKSAGHVMLEADPIRTVQTLPGVLSLSDFSVGLYVRGGAPDENLVLLDGTDVYNASHLFGLFSTFPADAAKSTELLRGGFPAKYGARLSSVLNVITDEGNKNQYEGIGGVSLLSSRLTLQGPVGRGSWLASGRRTYLEPILKLANLDTVFGYSFYDLQGKTHQVFSQDDQLTVAAYAGRDHFQVTPDGFDVDLWWGNKTFSAQWTHIFNPRWFSHFVVTGSDFDSKATIEVEGLRFEQTNDLTDWSFKGDLNWFPTQDHAAEIGWNVKWFTLNFHNRIQGNDFGSVNQDVLHIAGYVQDTWKVTNMFTLQPGFRASHFTEGGYNRFDPRLAGRYQFTTDTFFKAAWGIYHQPIFRVPREFQGITFLSDIWFMADTTAGPT